MAYMFGPGGQPILMGQVPQLIQQQQQQQPAFQQQQQQQHVQVTPQPQPQPSQKLPDYMSEEKLQEKGSKDWKLTELIPDKKHLYFGYLFCHQNSHEVYFVGLAMNEVYSTKIGIEICMYCGLHTYELSNVLTEVSP